MDPSARPTAGVSQRGEILETLRTLESWARHRQWRGSDQYDALNATRIPGPVLATPLGRRLVIQAVKRSPVDLREALGIPPGQNAVSLAWATSAYAINGFLSEDEANRRLEQALDLLERLRSPAFAEPSWGYHFDFQSRVFFYPRTQPNTIASVFAGMALLDAHERTGEAKLLDRAHGVGRFFIRHVPQTDDPPGAFFGYLAGDRSPIHNSNLLVCALLGRLSGLTGDKAMADAARQGVRWSVARQRRDGSWPYGERSNLGWVDGFHTGYVLEALNTCARAGLLDSAEDPVQRGLEFYRGRLFLDDGTPKYFANETYPIDMWSVAQGIQTFAVFSPRQPELLDHALAVFRFASQRMRRRDGLFVFQRRRLWRNSIPHVRGVVAPMVLALARLLAAVDTAASSERNLRSSIGQRLVS